MKEIAWVGSENDFKMVKHTNKLQYYDKDRNIMYYCISTPYMAVGRQFDDVFGMWRYPNDMRALYNEILATRMKTRK